MVDEARTTAQTGTSASNDQEHIAVGRLAGASIAEAEMEAVLLVSRLDQTAASLRQVREALAQAQRVGDEISSVERRIKRREAARRALLAPRPVVKAGGASKAGERLPVRLAHFWQSFRRLTPRTR